MKHKLNRLLSCALAVLLLAGYMTAGVSAIQRLHTDDKVSLKMVLEHPSLEDPYKKEPLQGARIALHPIAQYWYIDADGKLNKEGHGDMVLNLYRDLWEHDHSLSWGNIRVEEDYHKKLPADRLMKDIKEMHRYTDLISAPSDSKGVVKFENFQCGLYLVELYNADEVDCVMKPFLVTLPRVINGEYDMTGELEPFRPKMEITNAVVSVQVKKVWKGDREHFYEVHPEMKPGAPSGTTPKPVESGTPVRPEAGSGTSGTPLWPQGTDPEKLVSRPKSITIELLNNGQKTAEAKLSKQNKWTYTFENLPENGTWTVQEQKVEGYKGEVLAMEWVKDHYEVTIVNTADGVLVQTGQLKWPVPVMLVIGCSLVLVGYVMTRDKKKTEI